MDQGELDFGKRVIKRFLSNSNFKILSEQEVVSGNDLLAGLNKDSSTSYNDIIYHCRRFSRFSYLVSGRDYCF